ncbi:MAG: Methyltransferase type 11 [Schumannella sp.]|nr:Methyltransferase type 11 [Schumannella sp.]
MAPLPYTGPRLDFQCNVCGYGNTRVPLDLVQNREAASCASCSSSLRMRSVVHTLAMELFGQPLILPEFPEDRSIVGLGLSDWDGYAIGLASKLGYSNTYFHRQPYLDITDAAEHWLGRQRFVISSDVLEHIPVAGLDAAFLNSRRLLTPDGVCIFTVPFEKTGETREHFPRLHDYRIDVTGGTAVLHNTTVDGEEEIFDDLVFHGGEGDTLEMRMFTEPDLLRRIADAGFSSAEVRVPFAPEFGVLWNIDWAVPIVARA